MRKLLKSSWTRLFFLPLVFFVILVASYTATVKTIPVSFWDEMVWVGRSYFFQYYMHGDFHNPIWYSYESYDQPKLAEYAFGVWLYPEYLKSAATEKKPFSYSQFLANDGLYRGAFSPDGSRFFKSGDEGFPAFWSAKYGQKGTNAIRLITKARMLNVLLLAGATVFLYAFILRSFGVTPAVVCTVLYGFNPLLLQTGLKAHSEALFLLLFNASLLFMNLYFTDGRKAKHLILFSLLMGLCMTTKLNAIMLAPIFFVVNIIVLLAEHDKKYIRVLLGFVPAVVSFVLLVLLDPFTFPDVITKTKYLFIWRMSFMSGFQAHMYKDAVLPNVLSRIRAIGVNFFSPDHAQYFSGNTLYTPLTSIPYYNYLLAVCTVIGVIYLFKLALKKHISAIVILSSFVFIFISMCGYLILNWDRYYVQLVLFFVLFEILGVCVVGQYCISLFQRQDHIQMKRLIAPCRDPRR